MFTNYFKIALRNLLKHKVYSVINLTGLAVGMACAILILVYVRFELSYDTFHVKKDRLYRMVTKVEGSSYGAIAKLSGPWGLAAKEEIPEIEGVTRFVFAGQTLMGRGNEKFYEQDGMYADSSVFSMFSFTMLQGQPSSALTEPNTIVLTEDIAKKYFGNENPVGQTLMLDYGTPFKVTGVLENVPLNSHFHFSFLLSMPSLVHDRIDEWLGWNQFYTYVLLKEGTSLAAVEQKFSPMMVRHMGEQGAGFTPFLQPIEDIHLYSNLFREMEANSNVGYLLVLSAVGLFLLILGCVNFMNLATARATMRAKEIGVRKAAGADRLALSRQFVGESVFLSFLALLIALMLADILFPLFNTLTNRSLSFGVIFDGWFVVGLLLLTLCVGVIAGSYPAMVLSSFRPIDVLRGGWKNKRGVNLRKGLVVFQFAISAFFLIATGIVYEQLEYIRNKQYGFNEEQLLTVRIQDESLKTKYEGVKQQLLQIPGVTGVSISANMPGGSDYGIPYQPEGLTSDQTPPARILVVDKDFVSTFEMTIIEGKDFSQVPEATAKRSFIINQEAARQLGWDQSIGKRIAMAGINWEASPVIGVVKDFHYRSLHEPIAPLLIFIAPSTDWYSYYTVRVRPTGLTATLSSIEETFGEFDPIHPLSYTFFDEQFARLHLAEERVAQMAGLFALLAIGVACLGIFGLATFTTEQRTKEIGIRKVLGASVTGVVTLLSGDFLKLVALANLIAWPVAYYAMSAWLESFAYRVTIDWWIFPSAGGAALLIALLTVSVQAIKASMANPVDVLRYE